MSESETPAAPHGPENLARNYKLLLKLNEGGMGAIYKVRHRQLDHERVIKVLRPQFEGDDGFEKRFLREAQLVAQLAHPNIAQLFEYAVTPGGLAYMVIEFIDGLTLEQVLASSGPPSIGLALEIARQSLAALGSMHAAGAVHRDVSPDNLMLTEDHASRLRLKLIDLGIAKRVEERDNLSVTRTGTFLGKVRYAAPEQFGVQKTLDYRSDLYSLGVVLYEVATGVHPIEGEDTSTYIAGHLFRPPKPFEETDPEGRVPEELRAVILKALSKKREERHADAAEFERELAPLFAHHASEEGEIGTILGKASWDFIPSPENSTIESDEALWLLLERGTIKAESPGTVAVQGADPTRAAVSDGATVGELPAEPLPDRRRRMLVTGLVATAALAVGVGTAPLWRPSGGSSSGPALPRRAAITRPLSFGRYLALVVANDAYRGSLEPLNAAVSGAEAVGALLESRYGFEVQSLFNASYGEILQAIEGYRFNATESDNLLIYYAGHGRLEGDTGYWLPVDANSESTANWVSNRDVSGLLFDVPAKHVLVVADSCYSGTLVGAPRDAPPAGATEEDRIRFIEENLAKVARLALTSGGEVPVLDQGSGNYSVFTNALLSVLEANDDILETSGLHALVLRQVEVAVERLASGTEPGYRQVPEYAPIPSAGDDGGEFFFAPAPLQVT